MMGSDNHFLKNADKINDGCGLHCTTKKRKRGLKSSFFGTMKTVHSCNLINGQVASRHQ